MAPVIGRPALDNGSRGSIPGDWVAPPPQNIHQVMKQFQKLPLVILDEFLLIPASDQEQRDLLELMEYRCGQASTIFCDYSGATVP